MIYKDTQGNEYRRKGEDWQMLVKGRGWTNYDGTAYVQVMSEGYVAPTTIPPAVQTITPEQAEQEAMRSNRENELFVHYTTLAFEQNLSRNPGNNTPISVSRECCDLAQAMIDELKERGGCNKPLHQTTSPHLSGLFCAHPLLV